MNRLTIAFFLLIFCGVTAQAELPVDYRAETTLNLSSNGNYAPYFISSNVHGVTTQSRGFAVRGAAFHKMDTTRRFDFGFGIDMIANAISSSEYSIYNAETGVFGTHKVRPAYFWLQQIYGEVKYRGVFLSIGARQHESPLYNSSLGSGDFVESGNSRPMPEVRFGFIDFQNIPFTNGWVQLQGEYSFAKQLDSNWMKEHYNYYNNFITTNTYYSYKRLFFRTKPSQPFSVTIGMQSAMQLGGDTKFYRKGVVTEERHEKITLKSILHSFIPGSGSSSGNDVYYDGNHMGSWDFMARYRLGNGDIIKGYVQFPWEDGSGIGKQNGWDGIYGLEYTSARRGYITGAVVEYIDFRNQSGPMHWAPGDRPDGTGTLPGQTTGADDYYNNFQYNGYQYYGMSIGTPFLKSPLYNLDGNMRFSDNRVVGCHIGIKGNVIPRLDYRLLFSYRKSLGTPFIPALEKRNDTSMMLEGAYDFKFVKGLRAKCQVAFDRGSLYGNNFGTLLSVSYNGNFKF